MCQARKAWLDQSWEDCQKEQELAQGRENTLLAQGPQELQEHNKQKRAGNDVGLLEWKKQSQTLPDTQLPTPFSMDRNETLRA